MPKSLEHFHKTLQRNKINQSIRPYFQKKVKEKMQCKQNVIEICIFLQHEFNLTT